MAQWFAAKAEHPDALLFFRMGDFYELFFADAEAASAAVDIVLSHRGEHNGAPIPMCGVPKHAAETYLARLIRRGYRVAIVEQMEDPKTRASTRVPIRREVVRLVTPGTITEESLLDSGQPNLLLALFRDHDTIGAAWLDVSTGLFQTLSLSLADLPSLLGRLEPAEIIAAETIPLGDWAPKRGPETIPSPPIVARRRLAEVFNTVNLDAFGTFSDVEAIAAMVAADYVRATQAGALPRLARPEPMGGSGVLAMDAATRASLEIHRARDGGAQHTLLAAVKRTVTPAGTRLLGSVLAAPLVDRDAIVARQDAWSWMLANPQAAVAIRAALRTAPDLARALGRLSLNRGGPRDLAAVRDTLAAAQKAAAALSGPLPPMLNEAQAILAEIPPIQATLTAALTDPPPARVDDGGAIQAGFDGELDAHRSLRDDSRRVLASMQLDYAQKYGVASLKIRHHAQLGYVIEVPAASVDALRAFPELSLRQGMANGARVTEPGLSDLDRRITEAGDRAAAREKLVVNTLIESVLTHAEALAARADAIALLDVAQSAAHLAASGTWCRPFVTEDESFLIRGGRHPVVETALAGQTAFVPNQCDLSPDRRVLLLTGPNMAGKSTFLRQNALMAVLAQAGLPVPAEQAEIGIVDRLFSRVGAADDLARGRSTFMVEMTETAAILNQAGPKSLVIVDEIGRGTATTDGLAIAWAVLESIHSVLRCRTIFATHFHQLAELAERMPRIRPHTMRVKEWRGSVVFLHEVAEGAAGRSWGVHVAELAGVPKQVVRRAAALLNTLEKQNTPLSMEALPLFAAAPLTDTGGDETRPEDPLLQALNEIDPDQLTPRDALAALYRLKALVPPNGSSSGSSSGSL